MPPPVRAVQKRGNTQIEDGTSHTNRRTAVAIAAEETAAASSRKASEGEEYVILQNENGELKNED